MLSQQKETTIMDSKSAIKEVNRIIFNNRGYIREADYEFNTANFNIIFALAKEHDNKIVLFKYWPDEGQDRIHRFVPGEGLYTFCADYVVPCDNENYDKFLAAVKKFEENGISGSIIDEIENAVIAAGGCGVSFS
jgi:hypothetical protein